MDFRHRYRPHRTAAACIRQLARIPTGLGWAVVVMLLAAALGGVLWGSAGCSSGPVTHPPCAVSADFDGDGELTQADRQALVDRILADVYEARFDLNCDGRLDAGDLVAFGRRL